MGAGKKWSPYVESMKKQIDQHAIREIKEWEGYDLKRARDFKTARGQGSFKAYTSEKIEKIGIGDCSINEEIHYAFCTIFPNENFDLPIFISTVEEGENEITFLVDLMPTVDSLIDEEYRKKYLEPMELLWNRYANLPGICPVESDVIRSLCSIIYTAAQVPIDKEGMRLAALAPHTEYLKSYLDFLKEANPIVSDTKREEVKRKRQAIRKTLRTYYQELLKGPLGKAMGGDIPERMIHIFF
jgi:hypothetical protein